jgi:lipopolysaccharide export system permease protein
MRLLDRYLLRELLIPLCYCLGGFLVFWISFNLISRLGDFQERHLGVRDVLEYYYLTAPEILVVVLPVALLLALLYALTHHARYQELTAMRAAGVSLARLCLPYLAVGLLFTVAFFLVNEVWGPSSADRAEDLLARHASDKKAERDWQANVNFNNSRHNRSWTIGAFNLITHEMKNVHVDWHLPDGTRHDLYAERAEFSSGAWSFYNLQDWFYRSVQDSTPKPSRTNFVRLPDFSETPDLIRSEIKISNLNPARAAKRAQVPIRDILNYLRLHPELTPSQKAVVETQLQGRLAAPWTCLVVVLIAIPFGAPSGRRNVFVGVAASIFICFIYFILQQTGLTLGTGGKVAPWLAAWLPNLLFAGTGLWLAARVR